MAEQTESERLDDGSSRASHAWRDGDLLVLSREHGQPDMRHCVKTGRPVLPYDRTLRVLRDLELPILPRVRILANVLRTIRWGFALGAPLSFILAFLLLSDDRRADYVHVLAGFMVGAPVVFVFALIWLRLAKPLVRIERMTDELLYLRGVSPKYLALLPELDSDAQVPPAIENERYAEKADGRSARFAWRRGSEIALWVEGGQVDLTHSVRSDEPVDAGEWVQPRYSLLIAAPITLAFVAIGIFFILFGLTVWMPIIHEGRLPFYLPLTQSELEDHRIAIGIGWFVYAVSLLAMASGILAAILITDPRLDQIAGWIAFAGALGWVIAIYWLHRRLPVLGLRMSASGKFWLLKGAHRNYLLRLPEFPGQRKALAQARRARAAEVSATRK